MKTIILLIFLSSFTLIAKWEYFPEDIARWDKMVNHNNALIDSKGNIWFYKGADLYKYDGNEWKKYAYLESGIQNFINCIAEDKHGNIWIGTDYNEDLNNDKIFRIEGDSLIPFKIENTSSYIYFEDIKGLYFNEKNELLVITNRGFYQYYQEQKYWSINLIHVIKKEDGYSVHLGDNSEIGNTINYKNNILLFIKPISSVIYYRGCYKLQNKNKELDISHINNPVENGSPLKFLNVDSNYNIWGVKDYSPVRYLNNEWERINYPDSNFTKEIWLRFIDENNKKYFYKYNEYIEDEYIDYDYFTYNDIGFKFLFNQKVLQEDFEKSINRNDILLFNLAFKDKSGNYWFSLFNDRGIAKYTPDGASVKDKINITLFPNPAQNSVTINAEEPIKSLGLYSLNLSKIKDLLPNNSTSQELDISNLASGVYFIKVNDDFVNFVRE